jgi:hypothetical protein
MPLRKPHLDKQAALRDHIVHTNAMIALCQANKWPHTEGIYREQLALLTKDLAALGSGDEDNHPAP